MDDEGSVADSAQPPQPLPLPLPQQQPCSSATTSSAALPAASLELDMAALVAISQRITTGIRARTDELQRLQTETEARIAAERARMLGEIARERERLEGERRELMMLRGRVRSVLDDKKVVLNVGGTKFTTSELTLAADANSMLAVLVNGGFPVETDGDGAILIDRDPKFFPLILEFLRALRGGASFSSSTSPPLASVGAALRDDTASAGDSVGDLERPPQSHSPPSLSSSGSAGTPQSRLQSLAALCASLADDEKEQLIGDVRYFNIEAMERAIAPQTLIVAADGSTKYRRVSEALQDARDGDTVLVRRGVYIDSFVLLRRVAVVGEGSAEETVIRSPVATCVECRAKGGVIRNLTIEGLLGGGGGGGGGGGSISLSGSAGMTTTSSSSAAAAAATASGFGSLVAAGDPSSSSLAPSLGFFGDHYGIFVSDGCVTIENCEIRFLGLSCVKIVGSAPPPNAASAPLRSVIRNCNIHNAQQCGILVTNHARALVEGNEIHHNRFSGIEIRNAARPQLLNNTIYENTQNGVYVHSGGEGAIDGNRIFQNRFNGINGEGPVTIVRNAIYDNMKRGVFHGAQTIVDESNRVYNNQLGDIAPKR